MLFVDADTELPGPTVVLSFCGSVHKGPADVSSLPNRDIHRTGFLIDQAEVFRNGFKGEQAARNAFPKGFHRIGFVHLMSNQEAQSGEVPLCGLQVARIAALLQRLLCRPDIDPLQDWNRVFALKVGYHATVRRALSLPVAAARRLRYGIQTGDFPEHRRKIHIHPRFNQGSGHNPTGQPLCQPLSKGVQHFLPMRRVHQS